MIWTVMQINARRLLHNRVELLLTFVVPIAFFSIFAVDLWRWFGQWQDAESESCVGRRSQSEYSRAIVESLRESDRDFDSWSPRQIQALPVSKRKR